MLKSRISNVPYLDRVDAIPADLFREYSHTVHQIS